MARTRPKARQDRAVVRVTKCYRVHPTTAEAIADASRRSGLSQGQVVDRLVRRASQDPGRCNAFSSSSTTGDL